MGSGGMRGELGVCVQLRVRGKTQRAQVKPGMCLADWPWINRISAERPGFRCGLELVMGGEGYRIGEEKGKDEGGRRRA